MEQDHIIPVCRGGSDAIDNLALACRSCNQEKHRMTGDEFRAWKASR
jgi:5-methylcytosine-specific restriction endonuclease McrA